MKDRDEHLEEYAAKHELPPLSGSHWYNTKGERMRQVPKKSKPGEFRDINLRWDRELNPKPSVTSILKEHANPGLVQYFERQARLAGYTAPHIDSETEKQTDDRIAHSAREHANLAADLGTRTHKAIERWIRKGWTLARPDEIPLLDMYKEWHNENITNIQCVEHRFYCDMGYAGTIDMVAEYQGEMAVIDFKTQGATLGKKMVAYQGHGEQLAAYAYGWSPARYEDLRLINVMISTNPDDPRIEVIDHTDRRYHWWQMFHLTYRLWRETREYWPDEEK